MFLKFIAFVKREGQLKNRKRNTTDSNKTFNQIGNFLRWCNSCLAYFRFVYYLNNYVIFTFYPDTSIPAAKFIICIILSFYFKIIGINFMIWCSMEAHSKYKVYTILSHQILGRDPRCLCINTEIVYLLLKDVLVIARSVSFYSTVDRELWKSKMHLGSINFWNYGVKKTNY